MVYEANFVGDDVTADHQSTLCWTAEHIARLGNTEYEHTAVLTAGDICALADQLDVWDAWPLADAAGKPIVWQGGELWFALAVPRADDPEQRHHVARIHHFHRNAGHFEHLGETLPDGHSPGSREWSGSALLEGGRVTLYFTATGHRGDTVSTFHQRIFATATQLQETVGRPFGKWSEPAELFCADGTIYQPANQDVGAPGKLKGFRDPAFFRDEPSGSGGGSGGDGADYILFTGSSAKKPGSHDGVIGLARHDGAADYRLLPPLVDAAGLNNELERPHIVRHAGRLYLFWSTQRGVFAEGVTAPTGLYGATAEHIGGPWRLLNGHGLVFANPPESPTQAYSWWVLPDLSVTSFVDYWIPESPGNMTGMTARARFGGTFAPFVQIALKGANARLIEG